MRAEDLLDSLAGLPEEWVQSVDALRQGASDKKPRWIPLVATAACIVVCALLGWSLHGGLHSVPVSPESTTAKEIGAETTVPAVVGTEETVSEGAVHGPNETLPVDSFAAAATSTTTETVKDALQDGVPNCNTVSEEVMQEVPWEERSMPGKFCFLLHDGGEYVYVGGPQGTLSTKRAGTFLKAQKLTGRDWQDVEHTAVARIYALQGFDSKLVLGVQFEGSSEIYPYKNQGFVPATLGEFLDAMDFPNAVTFGSLYYEKDGKTLRTSVNAQAVYTHLLTDKSIPNDRSRPGGTRVTLSVSCPELNLTDKAFYVYENGYIATSLTGILYAFPVGEEQTADFLNAVLHMDYSKLKYNIPTPQQNPNTTTSAAYIPE